MTKKTNSNPRPAPAKPRSGSADSDISARARSKPSSAGNKTTEMWQICLISILFFYWIRFCHPPGKLRTDKFTCAQVQYKCLSIWTKWKLYKSTQARQVLLSHDEFEGSMRHIMVRQFANITCVNNHDSLWHTVETVDNDTSSHLAFATSMASTWTILGLLWTAKLKAEWEEKWHFTNVHFCV